ncbi:hypothetical protein [Arthrobacter sp. M4]|uniref:hypothetical protein n=1 Tax=Arthrobacter sp. M4 TaxID=218160 RepID=UPI001CDBC56D|nr:hypothetical protein [Arthrobacter sp. M4]MCA4131278.1 hypothetical protein [Arthrobacter sp. M4]
MRHEPSGLVGLKTIVSAAMLLLLTACSSSGPAENPWEIEGQVRASNFLVLIDEAFSHPLLSEFDVEVLKRAKATGRIAQADYDEAFSRYEHCMAASGEPVKLKKFSNGLYDVKPTPLSPGESIESVMQIVTNCTKGTIAVLQGLYATQQGNPLLLQNPYEVAYKCLESQGLVDSSFSFKKFAETLNTPPSTPGPRNLSLPFDLYSEEAQGCFVGAGMHFSKGD